MTIEYAVIVVVVENVVGLLLALALERPTMIHQAIRVLVFFPVFLAPLATGYAFKGVLSPMDLSMRPSASSSTTR